MIIVEGPDGSGKTTLIDQLLDRFGPDTLELGTRGTTNRDELYKVTVADTMRALAEDIVEPTCRIWDRLFFSDYVYADIQDRDVMFDPRQKEFVISQLRAQRAFIIVCLPRRATVVRNAVSDRHQMPGVKNNAGSIWDAYSEMCKPGQMLAGPGLRMYNYEEDNIYRIIEPLSFHLKERSNRTTPKLSPC